MLFRKRHKGSVPPPKRGGAKIVLPENAALRRIDFDMMQKGHVVQRRGGPVRQFAVTVGGSTRLVTSGDVVDRATYDALRAAGALRETEEGSSPDGEASHNEDPIPPGEPSGA